MAKSLKQIQEDERRRMRDQSSSKHDNAAKDLANAASQLNQTANRELQTNMMLAQTIQSQQGQIQTLNNSINMLLAQQRMMPSPAQTPPPMATMGPGGGFTNTVSNMAFAGVGMVGEGAGTVGGLMASGIGAGAGNLANATVVPLGQTLSGGFSNIMSGGNPAVGAQPGFLSTSSMGLFPTLISATGVSYSPSTSQHYTYGAYERATAAALGERTRALSQSIPATAIGFGIDNIKSTAGGYVGGTLGAMAGTAMGGPIGGTVGGFLGGAGGMLFAGMAPDPITYGLEDVNIQNMYGAAANRGAYKFLRGRGGRRMGSFDMDEEARIGRNLRGMTAYDLHYGEEDMLTLQEGFSESGHLLGVNTADQYSSKFKKLLDTHKRVQKILGQTTEEALQTMKALDMSAGMGSAGNITRLYAASHIAGLSPTQVTNALVQGAGRGVSSGLTAGRGGESALGGLITAGEALRSGSISKMDAANVGGERGVQAVIERAQNAYISGVGGYFLAGGGGGGVDAGFRGIQNKFRNPSDIINAVANRHRLAEDVGTFGVQQNQAELLFDLANKIRPGAKGEDLKSIMMMLAQQQGLAQNPAEAEILIKSFKDIHGGAKRAMELEGRANSDMRRSLAIERFGIANRAKLAYRKFMRSTGGEFVANSIAETSARIGYQVEGLAGELQDYMTGVTRNQVDLQMAREAVETDRNFVTAGSMVDGGGIGGKVRNAMDDIGGDFLTSELNRADTGLGQSSRRAHQRMYDERRRYAMQAIKEGAILRNLDDFKRYRDRTDLTITDKEMYAGLRASGADESIVERFREGDIVDPENAISMDQAAKRVQRLVGSGENITGMRSHEIVSAFNDKKFQAFMNALREADRLEGEMLSDENPNRNSPKGKAARRAKRGALELYEELKKDGNANTIRLAESMLKFSKTKIERGKLVFDRSKPFFMRMPGFISGGRGGIRSGRGVLDHSFKEGGVFDRGVEAVRDAQVAQTQKDFLGAAIGSLAGDAGTDSYDEFRGIFDRENQTVEPGALAEAVRSLSPDDIGRLSGGNALEKSIAALASRRDIAQMSTDDLDIAARKALVGGGMQTGEVVSGVRGYQLAEEQGVIGATESLKGYVNLNTTILEQIAKRLER